MNRANKHAGITSFAAKPQHEIRPNAGTIAAFLIETKMPVFTKNPAAASRSVEPAVPAMRLSALRRKAGGFTVIQAVVAMGIVSVAGAAGMMALVQLNNKAASMRTLNNARAVVQRNIDTALGVPFSTTQQPAILAITSASGSGWDDDGGGDNLVTIYTPKTAAGTPLKGTLTRIVTAQANSDSADIRRVTFRINYTVKNRVFAFSMTTLRGSD